MARIPANTRTTNDPNSLLRQFTNEIDRLFDQDLAGFGPSAPHAGEWAPAVDVREEEDKYVIQADVPGMKPEDLEVTLDNGVLSIRGERSEEKDDSSGGVRHIERAYGSFVRRFSLPEAASDEDVDARVDQGVLTLTINKKQEGRPRRIEVRS